MGKNDFYLGGASNALFSENLPQKMYPCCQCLEYSLIYNFIAGNLICDENLDSSFDIFFSRSNLVVIMYLIIFLLNKE